VLAADALDFDFGQAGYAICIVAVGADHAANTADYAAVPAEMQAVAAELGAQILSQVDEGDVIAALPRLRERLGDRAALRALHYYREERLVAGRAEALRTGDVDRFLELTRLSGASSAMYLQNVSLWGREQNAMVALAIADEMLGDDGAARIHGGGFGGTIQAFVPLGKAEAFSTGMDFVFGAGSCGVYQVESEGARSWRA
jgi:galactokinase